MIMLRGHLGSVALLLALSTSPLAQHFKLSGEDIEGGGLVNDFAFTPDNRYVVYLADQEVPGRYDVHVTRLDGPGGPGGTVRLNEAYPDTEATPSFQISADGSQVLFQTFGSLHSAPIDGSAPAIELSSPVVGFVRFYSFAPDGEQALFYASGAAFLVPLDGSLDPQRVSPPEHFVLGTSASRISNGRLIYAHFDGGTLLYSVPLDGSEESTLLSRNLSEDTSVHHVHAVTEGRVVYSTRSGPGLRNLYSIAVDGNRPAEHLNRIAEGPIFFIGPSPTGRFVAFTTRTDRDRLYVASAVAQPLSFLHATLPGERIFAPSFGSDEKTCVFMQGPSGAYRLYSSPSDGSAPAQELSSLTVTILGDSFRVDRRGRNAIFSTSATPNGQRSVYAVPLDGSREPRLLSIDFENQVSDFVFTPDGRYVVILHRGVGSDDPHLYVRSVAGLGEAHELLGATAENGRILGMAISPGGTHVVFDGNLGDVFRIELFASALPRSSPLSVSTTVPGLR